MHILGENRLSHVFMKYGKPHLKNGGMKKTSPTSSFPSLAFDLLRNSML